MSNWKSFEKNCVKYLNMNYGNEKIKFIEMGKSNSTTSDISVEIDGVSKFLIEAKMSQAQSGQFVVLIDEDKFTFSPKNKTNEDDYSKSIVNYLNQYFPTYKDVGTAGLKIDISMSYFSNWIKKYYKSKNVKYIITEYMNNFIILPIEKYDLYFNITSNLRRKTSGSSDLPNCYIDTFKEHLENNFDAPFQIIKNGKKQLLETTACLDKYKVNLSGIDIYIGKDNENLIIKKLGKTKNPTIIFSIVSIAEQMQEDLIEFKKNLEIQI
ncbi:MAG: hypothetical protein ACRCZ2_00455 [Fusobacteriaceae bacterium]